VKLLAAARRSTNSKAAQEANEGHGEPIGKRHGGEAFDCGEEALNEFLRRYARKSHERGGAKTYLAIANADNQTVVGFYI